MSAMLDPPILLSTAEVARRLDVSEHTVRRLVRGGHLRARQIYPRSRLRFLLEDVERLLAPGEREEAA